MLRNKNDIHEYLDEAFDKVWLMRNCCVEDKAPVHEASRIGMERIFEKYNDIPSGGYTDWECGYWNGILAALRWASGEERDFLDT